MNSKSYKRATMASAPNMKAFVFPHNKKVYIYQQNIVHTKVDAIVMNSGNGTLEHGASATGHTFSENSYSYVRRNRSLAMGQAHQQRAAGSLLDYGIKFVIHVVGPEFLNSTKESICKAELAQVVLNSLLQAEILRCRSVALTAISSGNLGLDICAEAYFEALLNFACTSQHQYVKEIHFVNIDATTTKMFQKKFEEYCYNTEMVDVVSVAPATHSTNNLARKSVGCAPTLHTHTGLVPTGSTSGIASSVRRAIKTNGAGSRIRLELGIAARSIKGKDNASLEERFHKLGHHQSRHSSIHSNALAARKSVSSAGKTVGLSQKSDVDPCSICLETAMTNPRTIKCGHIFCRDCIGQWEKMKGMICPNCTVPYGAVTGDQPKGGTMTVDRLHSSLPGYSQVGTILINYSIPGGQQEDRHPNPGVHYYGIQRAAYLPDNRHGNKILKMLRKAFDARLIFTVGQSRTTGATNQITWNDIHHKTSTHGGSSNFGYPDTTYLSRVESELRSKGITSD